MPCHALGLAWLLVYFLVLVVVDHLVNDVAQGVRCLVRSGARLPFLPVFTATVNRYLVLQMVYFTSTSHVNLQE